MVTSEPSCISRLPSPSRTITLRSGCARARPSPSAEAVPMQPMLSTWSSAAWPASCQASTVCIVATLSAPFRAAASAAIASSRRIPLSRSRVHGSAARPGALYPAETPRRSGALARRRPEQDHRWPALLLGALVSFGETRQVLGALDWIAGHAPGGQRWLDHPHGPHGALGAGPRDVAGKLPHEQERGHTRVEGDRLERVQRGEQAVVLDQQHRPLAADVQAGVDRDRLVLLADRRQ